MEHERAPALFVAHGSPMVALDDDDYTRSLEEFGRAIPRPAGIVVISAHWELPLPLHVTAHPAPPIIYDFGGFPPALYKLTYPAPGSPDLAADVQSALRRHGLRCEFDRERGLDHGVWIPMRFLFPRADVPVVQLSLPASGQAGDLLAMGRALSELRDRRVLVVGSGGIVHNLARVRFHDKHAPVDDWARVFDQWVAERLLNLQELLAYRELAPFARLAVPTAEHFNPILPVLSSRTHEETVRTLHEGFQYGNLSMRTFAVSPAA